MNRYVTGLALMLLCLTGTARAASAECEGNFVNPITDICWECIFPVTIGNVPVAKGRQPDTPNPSMPIQFCPMGILYRVGLAIGYWEPMALTDVTRSPYCMVNLGGFTWNQFCDWYLELTKPVMNGGTEAELRGTRHTLVTVLEGLLRLAHPIIPFITETIWQRVKVLCGITADTIMLQPFPQYDASQVDEAALADTEWLKQAIVAVRNIRAEMNIAPGKPLELLLRGCSADQNPPTKTLRCD